MHGTAQKSNEMHAITTGPTRQPERLRALTLAWVLDTAAVTYIASDSKHQKDKLPCTKYSSRLSAAENCSAAEGACDRHGSLSEIPHRFNYTFKSLRIVSLARSEAEVVLLLMLRLCSWWQQDGATPARLQVVREKSKTANNSAATTGMRAMKRALEQEDGP